MFLGIVVVLGTEVFSHGENTRDSLACSKLLDQFIYVISSDHVLKLLVSKLHHKLRIVYSLKMCATVTEV